MMHTILGDDARQTSTAATPSQEALTDAVLAASRALVAIALRSLTAVDEQVTMTQYRALVVLAYAGAQRTGDLAQELGVNSSTATRLVDRLTRRGLARRRVNSADRRATHVEITASGRDLVASVMARRRSEIATILGKMPLSAQAKLVDSLDALRTAAGEAPEQHWTLGWRR